MTDNPQIAPALASGQVTDAPALRSGHGALRSLDEAQTLVDQQAQELRALRRQLAQQESRIACFQEIGVALGSTLSLDELLNVIMEKITFLMDADRSTLFLLDERDGALWSKIIQGDSVKEIRLRVGDGIAGWVAATGKSVNIRDAYRDARFNQSVDRETGYHTRSVLCQPVRNAKRQIIGVVQVLNSTNGHFTVQDENLLSAIASQAAVSIENSRLYLSVLDKNLELTETQEKLERKITEVDRLYEVQSLLTRALDLPDLIQSAASKMVDIIRSEACAVTIKAPGHLRLFVLRKERGELNFHMLSAPERGISAQVIDSGEPFICNADGGCVPEDPVGALGDPVRSIVAVPLFAEDRCIGTMELMNKLGSPVANETVDGLEFVSPHFDGSDLKLLSLMASQISRAVSTTLYRERQEKANRLATIGQLLSGVIHDFKTPVTIISGYVQLMASQDDPNTRREYAGAVIKQFDQLNKMTKELLAFARGETSILFRKVFLHKMADEFREHLTGEFRGKPIELTIENNFGGSAKMDEVKIKRAIYNLARNAAEAMPEGGKFGITIDKIDEEIVFRVSDTGGGIPVEIRENLFESFVTKGKEQGTGLGLAIVKKIVEDHQGHVTYETETGKGTTFILHIPVDQE